MRCPYCSAEIEDDAPSGGEGTRRTFVEEPIPHYHVAIRLRLTVTQDVIDRATPSGSSLERFRGQLARMEARMSQRYMDAPVP